MILLIGGASHTGKTVLAQRMLEKYGMPYLSLDHLKMGLIRSGYTDLTPQDDEQMTGLLWPIVKEILKTAIENHQNLTVEGCYIPFTWAQDFDAEYRQHIRYICLVMTEEYIRKHFSDIQEYANTIETRLEDGWLNAEKLIEENDRNREQCEKQNCQYLVIDKQYRVEVDFPSLGYEES